jgi:hypothetical protein
MKESTAKVFASLKLQGHTELFDTDIRGLEFIFRPLTFAEYTRVLECEEYMAGLDLNDHILRIAVLYVEGFENVDGWLERARAIEPDQLAEQILLESGFGDKKRFLKTVEECREEVAQIETMMQLFICAAFRAITPMDVKNMTLREQLSLCTKAEEILGKKIDFTAALGEKRPHADQSIPIPEGYESTDPSLSNILSPEAADKPPDLDKILKDQTREHY